MGRAGTSLRQLVKNEVMLTVPSIEILHDEDVVPIIAKSGPLLVAVEEDFRGLFSGRALLIFPEESSLELVRTLIGCEMQMNEFPEFGDDAIKETGNIVLNCWMSTLANLLKHNLILSIPRVVRGDGSVILSNTAEFVLFLHIDFSIRGTKIGGYIALLMGLPSLGALRALIADFVASTGRS